MNKYTYQYFIPGTYILYISSLMLNLRPIRTLCGVTCAVLRFLQPRFLHRIRHYQWNSQNRGVSKITKLGPLSCHPTNQQPELPRGSHRVKALAYSDLDATFRKCSREALPKHSAQTSEASIDRGPSRRQPKRQT